MLRQSLGEREACQTTGGAGEAPASGAGSRCAHRDPPAQAAARSADARKGVERVLTPRSWPSLPRWVRRKPSPHPCPAASVGLRGAKPLALRGARVSPRVARAGRTVLRSCRRAPRLTNSQSPLHRRLPVEHWSTGFAASPDGSCLASASRRAGRRTIGGAAGVSRKEGRAQYLGVETCSSACMCPVCASKIAEGRRQEVAETAAAFFAEHPSGVLYMGAFTMPHHKFQSCEELRWAVTKAFTKVISGKSWNFRRPATASPVWCDHSK